MASHAHSTKHSVVLLTCVSLIISIVTHGQAPTHTGKFDFIDQNINGFWEYLPRDYNTETSRKYPLLIFMHGSGETGTDQSQATLNRVLTAGVPKLINSGNFPESFTVENVSYRFIILSPQIKNGLQVEGTVGTSIIQPSTIDAVIEYAKKTYASRIDTTRIYLAGLSMGGGAIWDYAGSSEAAAKKIAAVAIAAGAGDLSTAEANNIAASNLPVLATHNNVDDIVLVERTKTNISKIMSFTPAISPAPLAFYWDTPGAGFDGKHNVWGRTFEDLQPNATSGGNLVDVLSMSVYEWLLQSVRTTASLPVIWEQVSAKASNGKVVIDWSVSAEINIKHYELEKSSDGAGWSLITTVKPPATTAQVKRYSYTDESPFGPFSYYRVKQVDLDGQFTYSAVKVADLKSGISYRFFPNPFTDKIEIQAGRFPASRVAVSLLSPTGAVVKQEVRTVTTGDTKITFSNLKSLSGGMYYLVVKDEQGNLLFSGKLSKNNP